MAKIQAIEIGVYMEVTDNVKELLGKISGLIVEARLFNKMEQAAQLALVLRDAYKLIDGFLTTEEEKDGYDKRDNGNKRIASEIIKD